MTGQRPTAGDAWAVRGPLAVFAVGVALFIWSFGKWPDALVDFGRELYAPWRLTQGDALHEDIAWFNGPLSVWLNGLWMEVFGVSVRTLVAANTVILAVVTAMLFRLLRAVSSAAAATLACTVFLGIFAFNQYGGIANYNFITPYSHELTHGFALGLGALLAMDAYARSGRARWSALAGVCTGLCFLTQGEAFVACLGGTLARIAVACLDLPRSGRARGAALFLCGALLPPLAAFLWFARGTSMEAAFEAVLGSWRYTFLEAVRNQPFYRTRMGLDELPANLDAMLKWSLALLLSFGALAALSLAPVRPTPWRRAAVFAALALAVALLPIDWMSVGRPLPVFLLGLFGVTLARIARAPAGEARRTLGLRLALTCFAGLLLLKTGLNARVYHYGFVLAAPATALLVVATVEWLPAWLDGRGKAGTWTRAACAGVFAGAVAAHLVLASHWYGPKERPIGSGPDRFLAGGRGALAARVVDYLRPRLEPGDELLVLPEGVTLNYLLRSKSPTRYVNFMPPELAFFGEASMLEALERSRPRYVVLVHKDTSEYGARFFGEDYGAAFLQWVRANYRPVHTEGATPFTSSRFGIAVWERRE